MSDGLVAIGCDPTAHVADTVKIVGAGRLSIGMFATIEDHVLLDLGKFAGGELIVGSRAKIKAHTVVRVYGGRIVIGHRSTLGEFGLWAGHGGILVGVHFMVGPYVSVTASEHIMSGGIPARYQMLIPLSPYTTTTSGKSAS